jgi:transketolase
MIYHAQSGHLGGSLSAVEILVTLYYLIMNTDPASPNMMERDRFILSKGHAAPILYAILAQKGFFLRSILDTLRQTESILQGHPDMNKTPGVDFSSGSLGQGLSVGCGMALAMKLDGQHNRVFVLMGDGELNEGQVWEAAMAAAKYKLDNLTVIIDNNAVQLDGSTSDIMPMHPLDMKWQAFGWRVQVINGHSIQDLAEALKQDLNIHASPSVIIARTVKGKGISFCEHNYLWHGKIMDYDDYRAACRELEIKR